MPCFVNNTKRNLPLSTTLPPCFFAYGVGSKNKLFWVRLLRFIIYLVAVVLDSTSNKLVNVKVNGFADIDKFVFLVLFVY
jgi:hypothetical protein